jgi:hypothetical protein
MAGPIDIHLKSLIQHSKRHQIQASQQNGENDSRRQGGAESRFCNFAAIRL